MEKALKPTVKDLGIMEKIFYQFETFTLTGNTEEYEFDLDNNFEYCKGFSIVDSNFSSSNYGRSLIVGVKQFGKWIIKPIPRLLFSTVLNDIQFIAGGSKVKIYIDRTRLGTGVTNIELTVCFLLTNKKPTFINPKIDYYQQQTIVPNTTGNVTERIVLVNEVVKIKRIWIRWLYVHTGNLEYIIAASNEIKTAIRDNIKYYVKNFVPNFNIIFGSFRPDSLALSNGLDYESPKTFKNGMQIFINNNTLYLETTNISTIDIYPEITYEYE